MKETSREARVIRLYMLLSSMSNIKAPQPPLRPCSAARGQFPRLINYLPGLGGSPCCHPIPAMFNSLLTPFIHMLLGRQGSAEINWLISEKCKLCTQTLSTGSTTNAFKSSPIKSIHHPYEKETVLYNIHAQIVTLLITSQTGVVAVWEHGLVPSLSSKPLTLASS
jgi:hypothetical protein